MSSLNIEGLLHIRDLSDDYYYFEEQQFRLVGKRTKQVFRIGSPVYVEIVNVNIDKRQIDLKFIEDEETE